MLSRRDINAGLLAGTFLTLAAGAVSPARAVDGSPRILPAPAQDGGMPLLTALRQRRSVRDFDPQPLSDQHLSNLLWAAFGVNRPSGDHTAPAWRHEVILDLYAVTAEGAWLYDAPEHRLLPVLANDIRAETGTQPFVGGAPLNLVYVGAGDRMGSLPEDEKRQWASANAGFLAENVYLYCASEGLGAVFRANIDRARLGRSLGLAAQRFVIAAQTVGYPKG